MSQKVSCRPDPRQKVLFLKLSTAFSERFKKTHNKASGQSTAEFIDSRSNNAYKVILYQTKIPNILYANRMDVIVGENGRKKGSRYFDYRRLFPLWRKF